MNEIEEFSIAVAREVAVFQGLSIGMAEAVVYASPSVEYLNECVANGYTAKQTALGFTDFQEQYIGQLFSNAKIKFVDNSDEEDSDDIPF